VTRGRARAFGLFLGAAALLAGSAPAHAEPPRRLALVVGANQAPPGRQRLRYSYEDARRVADVLTHVAGFDAGDVSVLLDPAPRDVLGALDRLLGDAGAPARETVLFFYYSGHADDAALYPAGQPLPMAALKPRLEDGRAKVRIGIIDACRGGGWTGTKGLRPADPFEVDVPFGLSNEGSILIASSSGLESAHESEALRGSFFTHYWNGGLRGAADRNGDGRVTVNEAFEYARTLTIRDTALVAGTPQHPSFHMNLAGRQDFTLATLESRRSALVLEQRDGPLELVHLDSGLVVLETARGRAVLRLGLAAGHYLVRRRDAAGIWAREIAVPVDGEVRLAESGLELVRPAVLAAKNVGVVGGAPPAVVPVGHVGLDLAFGVRHARVVDPGLRVSNESGDLTGILRGAVGFAPGWHAVLPAAVARAGGVPGGWEWIAWGGLPVLGASRSDAVGAIVVGALGAGLDLRRGLGAATTFNLGASGLGSFRWVSRPAGPCHFALGDCPPPPPDRQAPTTWIAQLTAGFSREVGGIVTFDLAVGAAGNALFEGAFPTLGLRDASFDPLVAIGSLQRRGLRPLPLVRVQVTDSLALDVYAVVAYALASRTVTETYMGGASWLW